MLVTCILLIDRSNVLKSTQDEVKVNSYLDFQVIPADDKEPFDRLSCRIGNYRYLENYQLEIVGSTPFTTQTSYINLPVPRSKFFSSCYFLKNSI